jgi:hypothetical protein
VVGLRAAAQHGFALTDSLDGDEPGGRAVMVLLATIAGYPEFGPVLFPHIHQQAASRPMRLGPSWPVAWTLAATAVPGATRPALAWTRSRPSSGKPWRAHYTT